MNCVVCGGKVDFDIVRQEFESLFNQVNIHGVESLTEQEQVVWEGDCCSQSCFDKLE